ncbi:MAG: hypothetical protein R3E01_33155 [Pirellulaceae bacterium]|nr:hypothetical protein [Planctomycetales bacterium]
MEYENEELLFVIEGDYRVEAWRYETIDLSGDWCGAAEIRVLEAGTNRLLITGLRFYEIKELFSLINQAVERIQTNFHKFRVDEF